MCVCDLGAQEPMSDGWALARGTASPLRRQEPMSDGWAVASTHSIRLSVRLFHSTLSHWMPSKRRVVVWLSMDVAPER
jgi:hypothetical protein